MEDDWLGELAFVHYWRVLEEHGRGLLKAPEFSQIGLAERQAWIEAAKAVADQARGGFWVTRAIGAQRPVGEAASAPIRRAAQ